MNLTPSQSLHQRQSIQLKQSLVQKLRESIKEIRWRIYRPKDELAVIDSLIEKFLETLVDDNIKTMMTWVFKEDDIQQMMIDESLLLSMPKKQNIDSFIYKYVFKNILEEQNNIEGISIPEDEKLKSFHERFFVQAITNKQELIHDIDATKKLMETKNSSSLVLLEDFRAKTTILNLVDDDMIQTIETFSSLLQFLLKTKLKKDWETKKELEWDVLWFLRERVILEEMTDFSSERLLKRFLTHLPSFSHRTESANSKDLKYRTMDVIWEFMLISLGIIDSEIFQLQQFSLDSEKINKLMKNTDTTMEELELLFKYYNLRWINWKPVFYNRWFTQNEIPSKESDLLIRDFLLKLKEYREEILVKFGYNELEKNIILIKRDKNLENEEKEELILDDLNERLASESFIKEMIKLISNYRYKDTYKLINPVKKL